MPHPSNGPAYTNALIHQTSPYLLQHAHNPVDWHPWGEEAFELARQQQRPIFLSVGYSTCYWCHVMEREVFENPTIAAKMNKLFINIKVDREERPDVDDLYMTATQLMTRSGGWPMSVFLTPPAPPPPPELEAGDSAAADDARGYHLKPFWCGTYLPPEPAHGRPSFPQVLDALHHAWTSQRPEVLQQAQRLADGVAQTLASRDTPSPPDGSSIAAATRALLQHYDPEHGGFGDAPKFPQPTNLSFLLATHRRNAQGDIADAVHHTLDRMARGGMYDQVGGGFHRYSVDEQWLVPHFEKMLYDNGQLLSIYAQALQLEREQQSHTTARATQYARTLTETAEYVLREMTDRTGAFWSAQDAEVNAHEGENYLWTIEQVREAIPDEALAATAVRLYGLDRGTNFRDPHAPQLPPSNVLYLPLPIAELAADMGMTPPQLLAARAAINQHLLAARQTRDQPTTDDKVLVSWNGLMIRGLAEAGAVLGEPRYIEAGARAADAIVHHMADPASKSGLLRSMRGGRARVPAFLEDYAHFVAGLLALCRAGRAEYLDMATRYIHSAAARFGDEAGGYHDTLADQPDLFVRVRSTWDGALPTGNAVMLHNLLDLFELTGDRAWLTRAMHDLSSFAEPLQQRGSAMIHMQHALMRALEPPEPPEPPEVPPASDAEALQAAPDAIVTTTVFPDRLELTHDQPATLHVTLRVREGFHLNGHSPALDFLTPTALRVEDSSAVVLEVAYPEPTERAFAFAEETLLVYEGEVTLRATIRLAEPSQHAANARLVLTYQACDDSSCQAPVSVTLPVVLS